MKTSCGNSDNCGYSGNKTDGSWLADIVKDIISTAYSAGLKVVAVTSDMGSTNQAMWKKLGIVSSSSSVVNSISHPDIDSDDIYFPADVLIL